MYSVGRHWLPVYKGQDVKWGAQAAEWLKNSWYPICNVAGEELDLQTSLYLTSINLDVYGEYFWYLTETETGWPQIQLVPPHRIDQPRQNGAFDGESRLTGKCFGGLYAGCKVIDGVVKNKQGRPIAFHVLADQPEGDTLVSTDNMIRIREVNMGDETRSIPTLSHGINQGRSMLSGIENEQSFLEAAGRIALIENNEIGGIDPNDPQNAVAIRPGPPTEIGNAGATNPSNNPNNQNRNFTEEWNPKAQTRYFKSNSGGNVQAFQFDRPGGAWGEFQDRLCRFLVDPIWPYVLVNKEAELGGANCRAMIARANRLVQDRQDLLRRVARKAVQYAVAKASKIKRLPSSDHWYDWDFSLPARITVDFGRDSKAEILEVEADLLDPAEVVEARGVGSYQEFLLRKYRNQASQIIIKKQVEAEYDVDLSEATEVPIAGSGDPNEVT